MRRASTPIERRFGTLMEHLAQYDNYKKYRDIYEKYNQLSSKKADAFYDKYQERIRLYENAK